MAMIGRHVYRPWEYITVLLALTIVCLIEIQFSVVRIQFLDLPFLLVSTVAAIYGDYFTGLMSVIGGTLSVALIGESGFSLNVHHVPRDIAFFGFSLLIFYLVRKGRELMVSNLSLSDSMRQMEKASKKLKSQVRVNQKNQKRLNDLNQELRSLVDDIMDDENLWASGVKKGVQDNHKD